MVFCGVLRVFCGVLRVFCDVFASVLQYFHKTHKTPENHRKTLKTQNSQYTIRSCIAGVFKEQTISTVLHKTPFTKLLQMCACSACAGAAESLRTCIHTNHRKTPQNSHKTRFVKLRLKTPQNKRKTRKNVTKNRRITTAAAIHIARIRCILILQKYFRPVAKVHNTQYA